MKYFGWRPRVPNDSICVLGYIENVDDSFELSRGISRKTNFPDNALLRMDQNFRKAKKLADQLANISGLAIVNSKIVDVIKELNLMDVELLPVSILDHKGNDTGVPYFIVNPCTVVDCIDKEVSTIMWNPLDKELIARVMGLTLLHEF